MSLANTGFAEAAFVAAAQRGYLFDQGRKPDCHPARFPLADIYRLTGIHRETPEERSARAMMDNFFASLGQGFNAYLASRSRMGEIQKLNAKTDTELSAMGL